MASTAAASEFRSVATTSQDVASELPSATMDDRSRHAAHECLSEKGPTPTPAPAPTCKEASDAAAAKVLSALSACTYVDDIWGDTNNPDVCYPQKLQFTCHPCQECGFHYDLEVVPHKSIMRWLKVTVGHIHPHGKPLVKLLPICLAVSVILALLQADPILQEMPRALALTCVLLVASHTVYWMHTGLRDIRSFMQAYREWQPQCDRTLIARLVKGLARLQIEVLAGTKSTAKERGEPVPTDAPHCNEPE